jgi:aminoglycoside phosphotransferase family enzyme/predicted kinase
MDPLIAALRDPACYPHPAQEVALIETHISWVLLAGDFAYKVKKPVRLPFLDFGTLEARRRYCEDELRLNRRTAPDLYLEVVPIAQSARGPAIAAPGEPIEYAVKMRRFASDALADDMARRGALGPAQIDAIAAVLAKFHAAAPRAGPAGEYGAGVQIAEAATGNFDQIAALGPDAAVAARLGRLRAWTAGECRRLEPVFASRRGDGQVRECHGDLHLGNIAFIDGRAVPFDCIEFDPALRWIDVMSEVAFLVMDLLAHGLSAGAWRLLNAWLEASGDYGGIAVLRFYLVYRAMVRAKIARIRGSDEQFRLYVRLAESLAEAAPAPLVLMHGLSGSGKTRFSQAALERLGAVRVRSDVERKRLHGLAAEARTGAALDAGIYSPAGNRRTYEQLKRLAAGVLAAGYPAIIDAAFLRREQREPLRDMAARLGAPCVIAACTAPEAILRRRVAERAAGQRDASDAGVAVLEHQRAASEPFSQEERDIAVTVDTSGEDGVRRGLDAIAARLAAREEAHASH